MIDYADVLKFWFEEIEPKQWWNKDVEFDAEIKSRFEATYHQAIRCELYPWRAQPEGRLAEIIVLDQFPRNMYRDQAKSFAHDSIAVALTQAAIEIGADKQLTQNPKYLAFLYMPLMHSESLVIHELAVQKFSQPGLENNLEFEYKHKAIIERFGRYPHRNKILGRESTNEELEFLKQPNSSF